MQSSDKFIDAALRYGHESPTAFNRAFQAVHGVTPSAVQRPDTILKAFPRISFQITIKGVEEMDYHIVKKDAFRIVGIREPISTDVEENFKCVQEFWQMAQQSGAIPQILGLMNAEPMGLLGASTCYGDKEPNYYYIAVSTDKPTPENMFELFVPECIWAIFSDLGTPASIIDSHKRIFSEWLQPQGTSGQPPPT